MFGIEKTQYCINVRNREKHNSHLGNLISLIVLSLEDGIHSHE